MVSELASVRVGEATVLAVSGLAGLRVSGLTR